MELYGRKWYAAIVDNMNGNVGPGDHFFLSPLDLDFGVGKNLLRFQVPGVSKNLPRLQVPKSLFFDSHNYDVSFEFQPGTNKPTLQFRLKESKKPMGKLNIDGKHIALLALESGSSTVVLHHPEKRVLIPAADYLCTDIYLHGGDTGLFQPERISQTESELISIPKDGSATFKAGGPLKSTVEVKRAGSILTLDYKLVGADERSYEHVYGRSDKPPTLAIYKGDKKIASGEFEFG
jgi:hypothetical protein